MRSQEPVTLQILFSPILHRLIIADTFWHPICSDFIRSKLRETTMYFSFHRSDPR